MSVSRKPRWRILATLMMVALSSTASAQTITYTYDALGRVITATHPGGMKVFYGYDAADNRSQKLISATNQSPVATNDSLAVAKNVPKLFDPRGNDTDTEKGPLTITAKTNGAHGSVSITTLATLTYTPASGYKGSDSFTYTVTDSLGASSTASVAVTVTNTVPIANDDGADVTTNDFGAVSTTLYVLTNDSDQNGDPMTITSVTIPTNTATATIQNGNRIYVQGIHVGGTTFNYTISDGDGGTDTGAVVITRDAPDCPPPYNC